MTEAEWRTCGSRVHMRRMLKNRCFPPMHWVNFNLACIDRVRSLLNDERCLHYVRELAKWTVYIQHDPRRAFLREDAFAREAIRDLWRRRDDSLRDARIAAARAVLTAKAQTLATSEMVAVAVGRWTGNQRVERREHCSLLRDIFGNPFRPVAFSLAWRTDTVTALARGMYESRDFSAMPILADALQDAGCDNPDILDHCRRDARHARGCWVVDAVLGKE